MVHKKLSSLLAGAIAIAAGSQTVLAADDEITVGYFLEWPMPMLAAKASGAYEEALGKDINWVSFDTGTAMSAAMASGDVQISVSQGVPPFVVAASSGQDIQVVDVAVSYSENSNCVVSSALEIDQDSASELAGKKVAVPLGTGAHYGFIRQMEHFGVPLDSLQIVDMAPPDGAAALSQGAVDLACGWGGALARMKEHGNVLLTGEEKEALGILVFDVTTVPAAYAAEDSETLAKFLKVTADVNADWSANQSEEMLAAISKESGMDLEATRNSISTMRFPSVEEQLSDSWLGGNVVTFMKGIAEVFVDVGSMDSSLDSYDDAVNPAPLEAAAAM